MFGTSLIVCFSLLLLHGVAAKPYKPLNGLSIQDTIMAERGEEQHWDLQVAPPESLDMTSYDIDPSMKIWKRVDQSGPDGEYQMAEGDQAELHHPSMVEVVPLDQAELHHPSMVEVVPLDQAELHPPSMVEELPMNQAEIYPPSMVEAVPVNQDVSDPDVLDTVEWDVPGQDEEEEQYEAMRAYLTPLSGDIAGRRLDPEGDTDHADGWTPVDVMTGSDVMSPPGARLHSEPEEDFDDLYHADQPEVVQVEVQPPAGSDIREQTGVRLHLEPEEDLDDLYHQDQIVPEEQ
ncbi:uncharacterized protein si:ch211-217g15.3 [Gadus macrocephalus]|uniref:uncharacterized protein si:ch211-217g15.3 n=1 Tax=Gadus macrocephalus TaxID=80720 RepID=UPI0028CB2A2D|nr:uncharacterized protein si:ch211-217g15.3 [Gadus macrocephalus]